MRDDRAYLEDMLEATDRIARHAASGRDAFDRDELLQSWMVSNLAVIGEAARALSDDLRMSNPEVPWKQVIGMRNILVHRYFDIDKDAVWSAVVRDVPVLRERILAMLLQLDMS